MKKNDICKGKTIPLRKKAFLAEILVSFFNVEIIVFYHFLCLLLNVIIFGKFTIIFSIVNTFLYFFYKKNNFCMAFCFSILAFTR